MIKRGCLFLWITVCLVLVCNCSKRLRPDFHKQQKEFGESVQFPFTATEPRQAAILANYSAVELGMTKSRVAEILRGPDYWNEIRFLMEEPKGSAWVYAFHCTSRFCGTSSDEKLIQIFFDLDDQVTRIVPSENLHLQPKRKL